MKHKFCALFCTFFLIAASALAADPMATDYTYAECQGSLSPYPPVGSIANVPDSLTPVMINHVGRHGARFPSSNRYCKDLSAALEKAQARGTITPLGRDMLALCRSVMSISDGRWGALDSVGMAEQRGIAWRMYSAYPQLFDGKSVEAISSFAPRCMMSMYEFTHQLDRLCNRIEFSTGTGRKYDWLMRPFDVDEEYLALRKGTELTAPYDEYFNQVCPLGAIERLLGKGFEYESAEQQRTLAIYEYYILANMASMGISVDMGKYLTRAETNALWSCFNLRQYLQRTATTISSVPADIAATLLLDLINTTDDFLAGRSAATVQLRFGHAETLMPLLSLMRMPGCYYLTNYFDTVALHWRNFYVVPMASNLQMIVLKHADTGEPYVRFDLNERPVALLPASPTAIYIPWAEARAFLLRCLPLHLRP